MWKNLLITLLFLGCIGFAQAQNNFTALQNRINSTANNGILTLDVDYVATSSENRLNIGKNITIDLNGHIINRNLSEGKDDGGVFYVNSNQTLTLKDSNPTATHSPEVTYSDPVTNVIISINGGIVMGGNTNSDGGGIMVCPQGTLKFQGGTIAKNKAKRYGGGVYNGDGSSTSTADFNMTGGKIAGNVSALYGGGIYNEKNGRLVMRDSEVSGNKADSQSSTVVEGGGIYNDGYLEITTSSISNNSALAAETNTWGGGIYHRGKTLKITDSEITNNTAYYVGGGIACSMSPTSPTIQLIRTKISNNMVKVTGGGLYFLLGSVPNLTFHLKDCTIEDNEAGTYGGGVFIDGGNSWTCEISGNKIKNNKANYGGGLYLINSTVEMHNDSILDNKAVYGGGGICLAGYNVVFTMKDRLTIRGNTARNGGGLYAGETSYTVSTSFTMEGGTISDNIADSYGGGVYNRGDFTFANGTISDNIADSYGGGVYNRGDFTFANGTISDNMSWKEGGGVYNAKTFTLEDGSITGNKAVHYGGGVYNSDTFTFRNGSISNNRTTNQGSYDYGGGGVYNTQTFVLENGTISGNTSANDGGGVYSRGTFRFESGMISDNTAYGSGGGVYNSATFTLHNGTITRNHATSWGGGLYSRASFAIENGTVTYNTARSGGGIYYYTGTSSALINGGTISYNEATSDGGGVYGYTNVTNGGNISFTMNAGAIISHNTAAKNGGGVFFGRNVNNESTFTINSGHITDNTAKNGGGMYSDNGTLILDSCTIANNRATAYGGGIYNKGIPPFNNNGVNYEAKITMSENSMIRNNNAASGGGVYNHGKRATFTMPDGRITDNTATASGGGIYNFTDNNTSDANATILMSGGTVTGNSAPIAKGIYQNGTFLLSGAPVFDPDNDIYLYSSKTKDNLSGVNRVITKAGDINCSAGSLHVTLGVSGNNFYHGRNIVESGDGTVTEADLSLFTFDNKDAYNRKILFERYWPNDNGTNLPVIELFSPTWVGIVTEQPSGFAVGNIDSKEDLAWLISYVNGYNGSHPHPGVTAVITADVDMGEHEWVPIGTGLTPFKGSFNGQGHTISNLRNTTEYVNPGMFGYVDGGEVKNTFVASSNFVTRPNKQGYYGIIVDTLANGGRIIYSEATGSLTASVSHARLGGIVGLVSGSASETHSCISIADLTGYEMGGLVGKNEGSVANSLSYPKFTHSGTASDNIGGLAADNSGTVKNCYLRRDRGNSITSANYHAFVADGTAATDSYSPADYTGTQRLNGKYKYGQNDQIVNSTQQSLLHTLNAKVDDLKGHASWTRTMASTVNNDYPVLALPDFTCIAQVDTTDNLFLEYKADLNVMITKYNAKTTGGNICLYKANTTEIGTNNNSNVAVYIGENVGVLQAANNVLNATVGITFDNSDASLLGGKPYDWHMFATPLQQPSMGIGYADNIAHGYMQDPSSITLNANGYLPTDTPYGSFDFYCYSEPYYHWINFKRNSADHWHEDEPHDNIPYTNETTMERGKGYMMAVDKETMLMSTGVLNNADFDYPLSYTEALSGYEAPLRGCNLIGNPYQSYLDFDMLANDDVDTYYIIDADHRGYIAYTKGATGSQNTAPRYIHPHQGFFVRATASGQNLNFTNDMRQLVGKSDSHFRDGEVPAYPLVNLTCTDADGKRDYATLELERPTSGGGEKVKGLRTGNASVSIHINHKNYQIAFAPSGIRTVPVHFKAYTDGNYTIDWGTENGDFSHLHLIDNLTGTDIDCLQTGEYKFFANTTDYPSRFRLEFQYTGVDEHDKAETFAFLFGDEIIVNGDGRVELYDLNGRLIKAEEVCGPQSSISKPDTVSGMYLLRLTSNKKTYVQKIVIR